MGVVAQRFRKDVARSTRKAEERLFVRFPAVVPAMGVLGRRLTPRSKLRQRLLARAVQSGWAAVSRQDLDLMLTRYADDVVSEWPVDWVALGMPERVDGRSDYREAWRSFMEAWVDYRISPDFLIDGGNVLVVLGNGEATGRTSAAGIEISLGQVLHLASSTNLVARERFYTDWAEALDHVGIDGDFLARLEALDHGDVLEA